MADFQEHLSGFRAKNIAVVAASADTLEDARATVDKRELRFPVAYGLDVRATSAALGAFYSPDGNYLHATNFLVAADGTIACASYSTGPIGRFNAEDALALATHLIG